jgi:hypothetical protein|eukprot:COSAG01_NODE_5259_length_4377_cov_1089.320477_1_plen_553_part_00
MPGKARVREPQTTISDEIDFPPLVRFEFTHGCSLLSLGGGGRRAAEARQACVAALSCSGDRGGGGGVAASAAHESLVPPLIKPSVPHSFCIKMTRGSFVDYTRSCLLHCGIADRTGCVWNFDEVKATPLMHDRRLADRILYLYIRMAACGALAPAYHVLTVLLLLSSAVPFLPPSSPVAAQGGHHRHASWRESICVPLPELARASGVVASSDGSDGGNEAVRWSVAAAGRRSFDSELAAFDAWHRQRGGAYHDTRNNCYHYAVGFLNHVSRPFPSWNRSILTEIQLCHACSCQEISRVETAGQVCFRGRTDHTIHTIERELLTKPCLAAVSYLSRYKRLAGVGASASASGCRPAAAPPPIWHPSTVICLLEQQDGKSVLGLTSAKLEALVRRGEEGGQVPQRQQPAAPARAGAGARSQQRRHCRQHPPRTTAAEATATDRQRQSVNPLEILCSCGSQVEEQEQQQQEEEEETDVEYGPTGAGAGSAGKPPPPSSSRRRSLQQPPSLRSLHSLAVMCCCCVRPVRALVHRVSRARTSRNRRRRVAPDQSTSLV